MISGGGIIPGNVPQTGGSSGPTSQVVGSSFLLKAPGNTLSTPEDNDYLIVVNGSDEAVIQFRTGGAWDTANETTLATPS